MRDQKGGTSLSRIITSTIIVALILAVMWSCEESPVAPTGGPVNFDDPLLLDKLSVSILVDGTEEITATARTATGEIDTLISCTSSDDGIVTATFIDSVITVRGIALGTATVTISSKSGVSKELPVRVYDPLVLETGGLEIMFTDHFNIVWFNNSGEGLVGSFYHPIPYRQGFYPLGSVVWGDFDPEHPIGSYAAIVVKAAPGSDALAAPVDYQLVWTDVGMDETLRCSVWKPIPPNDNYTALGLVAQPNWLKPSLDAVRCVKKSLTTVGMPGMWYWSTYESDADWAFVAWKIYIPAGGSTEKLLLDAGTFMGSYTAAIPSPDEVTRVLSVDIPILVDGSYESYRPELEGYDEPPAITPPVMARAILVPFTAVMDPIYHPDESHWDVHWQVTHSPFYRLERNVRYRLIAHAYNGGSADMTLSEATTVGFELTKSSEWWLETGVEITAEGGVGIGIASVSVSATVSVNLGFKRSTSITSIVYQELTKTMTIPPQHSGALWQKWNWFTLKRHNGNNLELAGYTTDFGSNSWVTDDYTEE
jgi:hypothetical protein